MARISESYVVSIDISDNGDCSVMMVGKREGDSCRVVNTFIGEDAEIMYQRLLLQPTSNHDNVVHKPQN